MLKRIGAGVIKTSDAAEHLGITVRHLNRLMLNAGVERPCGLRSIMDREAEERREAKQIAALAVIKGVWSVEYAAQQANASTRTIARWVERLKSG